MARGNGRGRAGPSCATAGSPHGGGRRSGGHGLGRSPSGGHGLGRAGGGRGAPRTPPAAAAAAAATGAMPYLGGDDTSPLASAGRTPSGGPLLGGRQGGGRGRSSPSGRGAGRGTGRGTNAAPMRRGLGQVGGGADARVFGTGPQRVAYEPDREPGVWKVGPPPGSRFSPSFLQGLLEWANWHLGQQQQQQPAPPPSLAPRGGSSSSSRRQKKRGAAAAAGGGLAEELEALSLGALEGQVDAAIARLEREVGGGEEHASIAAAVAGGAPEPTPGREDEDSCGEGPYSSISSEVSAGDYGGNGGEEDVEGEREQDELLASLEEQEQRLMGADMQGGSQGGDYDDHEDDANDDDDDDDEDGHDDDEGDGALLATPQALDEGQQGKVEVQGHEQGSREGEHGGQQAAHGDAAAAAVAAGRPRVRVSLRLERSDLTDTEAAMLADWYLGLHSSPPAAAPGAPLPTGTGSTAGSGACEVLELVKLWLFNCRLGDEGARALARVLHPGMREVHLSHNLISLPGATALLRAVPVSALHPSPPLGRPAAGRGKQGRGRQQQQQRPSFIWMRLEWNTIDTDGLNKVLDEERSRRGMIAEVPKLVAAGNAGWKHEQNLQFSNVPCHVKLPWVLCQRQQAAESALLQRSRLLWAGGGAARTATQPLPPALPSPRQQQQGALATAAPAASAAVCVPTGQKQQLWLQPGFLAAGGGAGSAARGPVLLFPDTSALLAMAGAQQLGSPPTPFTLAALEGLAARGLFGRSLPEGQQVLLVVADSVAKQLDALKKNYTLGPAVRRFFGQGLELCGPAGYDFLTVLARHEAEGVVLQDDSLEVAGSRRVEASGQRVDVVLVEVALYFLREIEAAAAAAATAAGGGGAAVAGDGSESADAAGGSEGAAAGDGNEAATAAALTPAAPALTSEGGNGGVGSGTSGSMNAASPLAAVAAPATTLGMAGSHEGAPGAGGGGGGSNDDGSGDMSMLSFLAGRLQSNPRSGDVSSSQADGCSPHALASSIAPQASARPFSSDSAAAAGGGTPTDALRMPVVLLSNDNGQLALARSHGLPALRLPDLQPLAGVLTGAGAADGGGHQDTTLGAAGQRRQQQPGAALTADLFRSLVGQRATVGLGSRATRSVHSEFDGAVAALRMATERMASATGALDAIHRLAGSSSGSGASGVGGTSSSGGGGGAMDEGGASGEGGAADVLRQISQLAEAGLAAVAAAGDSAGGGSAAGMCGGGRALISGGGGGGAVAMAGGDESGGGSSGQAGAVAAAAHGLVAQLQRRVCKMEALVRSHQSPHRVLQWTGSSSGGGASEHV